jgi:hypothetical protein
VTAETVVLKGKGKGKGKGKSNLVVAKIQTTEETEKEEVVVTGDKEKKSRKSAAEIYHSLLKSSPDSGDEDSEDSEDEEFGGGELSNRCPFSTVPGLWNGSPKRGKIVLRCSTWFENNTYVQIGRRRGQQKKETKWRLDEVKKGRKGKMNQKRSRVYGIKFFKLFSIRGTPHNSSNMLNLFSFNVDPRLAP